MRRTLELTDVIARRAKLPAVRLDMSLKAPVIPALEHELDSGRAKPNGETLHFQLIPSRRPGSRRLSPDDVHDILVGEEQASFETAQRH